MYNLKYFQNFAKAINLHGWNKEQQVFIAESKISDMPVFKERKGVEGVIVSGTLNPSTGVMLVNLKVDGVTFHLFSEDLL